MKKIRLFLFAFLVFAVALPSSAKTDAQNAREAKALSPVVLTVRIILSTEDII